MTETDRDEVGHPRLEAVCSQTSDDTGGRALRPQKPVRANPMTEPEPQPSFNAGVPYRLRKRALAGRKFTS